MVMIRRKSFWFAGFLLVVLAAVLALRLAGRNLLQEEMEEWRRAGLPGNSDELHTWYKPVPPEQNAALVVLQARDAWVAPSAKADPTRIDLPPPGQPLPPELREAIKDYLGKNDETLETLAKLREVANFKEARYPVTLWEGYKTLLPHLAQVKSLALLLRFESAYYSAEGDREKAVESIRAGFALARTLREEPLLISELVRIASLSITTLGLERLLAEHQLTQSEIDALSRDLQTAEEDGRRAIFRALVGERTCASWAFSATFSEFNALGGGNPPSGGSHLAGNTMFMLYKATGLRNRDTRIYLESMRDFIAAATNNFPESIEMAREAHAEMDRKLASGLGRFAMMSRMILPALTRAIEKEAVAVARLRAARMALQIEQHRLEHGSLPSEFPGPPLLDTFDGTAIRYERQEKGYRLAASGATKHAGTKNIPVIGLTVPR